MTNREVDILAADITPLILTFNEAPNIGRTLEQLRWAPEILVVDSFSTDATLQLLADFPSVRVVQRKFDSFAAQCNFALQQIHTPWVLSLDADYRLSDSFADEVVRLNPAEDIGGYRVAFTYCVFGRPLRGSLYPPRTVLYRRECARYRSEGHGHRVEVTGEVRSLKSVIFHDDRKPLRRWFAEQDRYMVREVEMLRSTPSRELKLQDRIRCWCLPAPFLVFLYTLFCKGLILDGWPGWFYVMQRTSVEIVLALNLIEARHGGTK